MKENLSPFWSIGRKSSRLLCPTRKSPNRLREDVISIALLLVRWLARGKRVVWRWPGRTWRSLKTSLKAAAGMSGLLAQPHLRSRTGPPEMQTRCSMSPKLSQALMDKKSKSSQSLSWSKPVWILDINVSKPWSSTGGPSTDDWFKNILKNPILFS